MPCLNPRNCIHCSGELLSVRPGVMQMVHGLFVFNERIVLKGSWQHGFFSMVAIGATNVGSIVINIPNQVSEARIYQRIIGIFSNELSSLSYCFSSHLQTIRQIALPGLAVHFHSAKKMKRATKLELFDWVRALCLYSKLLLISSSSSRAARRFSMANRWVTCNSQTEIIDNR